MPTEPQDPYADVLPTPEAPPRSRPPVGARPVIPASPLPTSQFTTRRRLPILIAVGVILVLGIGATIYFFVRKEEAQPTVNTSTQNANIVVEQNANVSATQQGTVTLPADKDADGLEDAKEVELGTDLNKADTDGDGLADREEVVVYQTDPKKPDTDGDGNTDGTEVKKGYNPKGSGLLLDFQAAKAELQ